MRRAHWWYQVGGLLAGVGLSWVGATTEGTAAGAAQQANGGVLPPSAHVLLVVGAGGEPEFGASFLDQASRWMQACETAHVPVTRVGLETNLPGSDFERLSAAVSNVVATGDGELWLVLIGHGTYDGKESKFNLRGADVSAAQLAEWLKPMTRPAVILNFASASGPALPVLSASNRVVITATRSGNEQNFARLGQFFAQTIVDPAADLDRDGQTSLLEAYLSAAARVAEFYKTEGRLASEHSLIDDNGDRLGTPSDWFRGLRPTKRAREGSGVDGLFAHQRHLMRSEAEASLDPTRRARRDELERQLDGLRNQRTTLGDDAYFRILDPLLVELAKLYGPKVGDAAGK